MSDGWRTAAFATVLPVCILFAAYALVVIALRHRNRIMQAGAAASDDAGTKNAVEDFITARRSVGMWTLAFSFYAEGLGSWVTTSPAIYSSFSGILGLAIYAAAAGLPFVIVAYVGALVRSADPGASSLPDFLRRRFQFEHSGHEPKNASGGQWAGTAIASLTSLVILFVQSLNLLVEYATLGTLFTSYVGCTGFLAVLPPLLNALLTTVYTIAGGLYVSILTDRLQAVVSLILAIVIVAFAASSKDATTGLPPLTDDQKGFNFAGFSSICSMPVSLLSSLVFTEATWQRIWAATDDRALKRASWMAFVGVSLMTFLFGFVGFVALWNGRAGPDTDPNLYFFAFFSTEPDSSLDSLPGLAALLCAAVLSEAQADSLQNGITATLSSTFLRGRPLWMTRAVVVIVNVPLAILATTPQANNALSLFLLSNMMTTCFMLPVAAAMIQRPSIRRVVTEWTVVSGCVCGVVGVTAYGWGSVGSFEDGVRMAWLGNNYGYDYFLVPLATSAAGFGSAMVVEQAWHRCTRTQPATSSASEGMAHKAEVPAPAI